MGKDLDSRALTWMQVEATSATPLRKGEKLVSGKSNFARQEGKIITCFSCIAVAQRVSGDVTALQKDFLLVVKKMLLYNINMQAKDCEQLRKQLY